MKWTYLLIDFATLFFPVVLSFESKVYYFKSWKNALISALIIAIPFLIWDSLFTEWRFWGFNEDYITGIKVFNLPIEEILFFIIIPFACTFIYEVVKYYFKSYPLNLFNKLFLFAIPLYAIFISLIDTPGYYTLSVVISSSIILTWLASQKKYTKIPLAFVICFVPFFIMNGILTGAITEEPVVWYNESQIITGRIGTIPFEDVLYNFTLLVANMLLFEFFQKRNA
ncbi:MAG TPA: lycopene cyclase domain-containing protein [Crocinitomicaceae bacterium]|nr:lycopene cyclase domain-containing protein [Crocinitomicaceae bacterium]